MKKYKITYTEGNTINKTITVEGESLAEAMLKFLSENPNAIYEEIKVVEND